MCKASKMKFLPLVQNGMMSMRTNFQHRMSKIIENTALQILERFFGTPDKKIQW